MPEPGGSPHAGEQLQAARYDHAFIVTYGRSGSTLLQGVLNALPGYLIRGENYDVMRNLELMFNRLPRFSTPAATEPRERYEPKDPFFGFENFNDATLAGGLRAFLEHVLLHGTDPAALRCLGFKEIRYTPENVGRRVAFLRRLFPGCAIIYNTRDPQDVVQSEFQKDKEVAYFEQFNTLLEEADQADPHSFLVKYEDVARGSGTLEGLHDFLGEPFDHARIDAVLSVKHSYHNTAAGQLYSNFPRFVQVNKRLQGLSLLVIDLFSPQDDTIRFGGLMLSEGEAEPRRIKTVLDERGRSLKFRAAFDLPSPGLAKRIDHQAAPKARFEVSFPRRAGEEHRVFFDNDELAVTIRCEPPTPA